jgi:hypothetical protein
MRVGEPVDNGFTRERAAEAQLTKAWARVRYGGGRERREAAQQEAIMAATFECLITPKLRTVTMEDSIQFDGAIWNINSRALIGRDQIHFTATRRA